MNRTHLTTVRRMMKAGNQARAADTCIGQGIDWVNVWEEARRLTR